MKNIVLLVNTRKNLYDALLCIIIICFSNCHCFSMVVYFPIHVLPEAVHVGVDQNNNEGVEQVKQEPHINHLHVGGLWEIIAHVDEHCC